MSDKLERAAAELRKAAGPLLSEVVRLVEAGDAPIVGWLTAKGVNDAVTKLIEAALVTGGQEADDAAAREVAWRLPLRDAVLAYMVERGVLQEGARNFGIDAVFRELRARDRAAVPTVSGAELRRLRERNADLEDIAARRLDELTTQSERVKLLTDDNRHLSEQLDLRIRQLDEARSPAVREEIKVQSRKLEELAREVDRLTEMNRELGDFAQRYREEREQAIRRAEQAEAKSFDEALAKRLYQGGKPT